MSFRGLQGLSMLLCQCGGCLCFCLNFLGCLHFLEETKFIELCLLKLFLPSCEVRPWDMALDFGIDQNIRHINSQFLCMGSKDSKRFLSLLLEQHSVSVLCVEPISLQIIRSVLLSVFVNLYSLLELSLS